MDTATDRAVKALADSLIELARIIGQFAVALAAAFDTLRLTMATIMANAYAAQAQGRDLNDEWQQVAAMWNTGH
jgi:hypothetical protein